MVIQSGLCSGRSGERGLVCAWPFGPALKNRNRQANESGSSPDNLGGRGVCADDRPVKKSLIDDTVPASFWKRRAAVDRSLKGHVERKDRYRSDATDWDKTDFGAAIAISPSTGKYASSCESRPFDLGGRAAREKCNAPDAGWWCFVATAGAP